MPFLYAHTPCINGEMGRGTPSTLIYKGDWSQQFRSAAGHMLPGALPCREQMFPMRAQFCSWECFFPCIILPGSLDMLSNLLSYTSFCEQTRYVRKDPCPRRDERLAYTKVTRGQYCRFNLQMRSTLEGQKHR